MKKKNISKKVLAVLLSVIMIATSIPFAIIGAAAGTYDPAPYFDSAAQIEGADAWLDDEGNVQVTFPSATAQPTYKGEALSIAFYILELVDMGKNNVAHSHTTLDTIKVTGNSGTFAAADIGTLDLENKRYSVTVTAVDTENWFSLPIYTTVTDVPHAEVDGSRFVKLSDSTTAVREIMTFESGDTDDGTVTGEQLLYMGVAAEAGTEDLSDNVGDTSALRFIMYNQPTETQIFDTSYSRQTWDYTGATEIWYWMDLSRVEITGLSFRLRTNEKMWVEWKDGTISTTQRAGETVYSTKGTANNTYAEGEEPYVWVQREDGGWNKVLLNSNGTIDLANFKGYIRVPLEYMCSETATYVDISNQEFGQKKSFTSGWNNTVSESNAFAWMQGMTFSQKVLVDAAGTSVTDALLIHRRAYKTGSGVLNAGTKHTFTWNINGQTHYTEDVSSYDYSKIGYMLAMPLDENSAKTSVTTGNASTDRAYVSGTTVQNRAAGLKAIDDIYNCGFSIEGCSAESLENSFFVDGIFFYRENDSVYTQYEEQGVLTGDSTTGSSVSTYYSEENTIAKIIFDEIDKYISSPDWADYREVEYILDLIAEYVEVYSSLGKDTTFLNLTRGSDTTGLAAMATTLGREETWERAWQAWEACYAQGTIASDGSFPSNAGKNDLVPLIVNTMEKLPAPESIASVSDTLRAEIVKLWQAYSLLNLGQLEMLGVTEEETLLKYFLLVEDLDSTDGDEFVVGQRLADNPFIVFNDFENYELGEVGWRLEDNKDAYTTGVTGGTGNLANDWRHIKSLVTYSTNGATNITDKDYYGYVTTDSDKSQEAMDGKVNYNAAWATITNEGYLHSKGVNLYSDSSFTTSENDGVFHTITVTKDGNPVGTDYSNNMSAVNLGGLAQTYTGASDTSVPLSLIFYVDFTQIENFYFTVNVFTIDEDGNHVKCRVNTGLNNADRKYWILDNETGEWEIIYTTNQWVFNSAGNEEESSNQGVDYNKIEGYSGYLMIPLYHIKQYNSVIDEDKLDEEATLLNNIFAIQFCIGGANATDMDEKSIIIDNVGFTYSKDSYTAASSRTDTSYADKFKAKSLPAKAFEDKVAEIDLYADFDTFKALVDEATAMYDALPAYQKTATAQAKMLLGTYTEYAKGYKTVPEEIISPEDLSTYVQSLPAELTGSSVTGENDIPHPGFTTGEVNYSTVGIDKATAEQIIQYYNEGYSRFSKTQKANMANRTEFLAAYNMSMRLVQTLESIKTEAGSYGSASAGTTGSGFLGELSTGLYTRKYDDENNFVGNFVSIAGREDVNTFKEDKYDVLQYYTKTTMDDGTYNSNVQNISRGFTYFLNNTQSYEVDGETIEGGIITFRDKMQDIYDMANDHITNKTLFTDEEFQSIKDIIEEYNALLPAYYNVEELYELEQAILALFPTASTETLDVTEVMLTADKLTGDASTYKVTYSEILDYDESGDYYFVRVTSTNGAMTNDYGDSVAYNIAINSETKTSDAIVAASPYTATVTNNAYTPASPMSYVITPSVSAAQTGLSGTVRDTLTVEIVLMEDGTETVIDTQSIEVSYSMGDAYTVTIPASFPVEWEDSSAQDVSYSVTTEMVATSKLTVGVTNDGTNKLTNTVTSDELTYTAENFVETEFGNRVTDAKPDPAPTVSVSGWDDVPVGEYRTTLTYTVVYDDGSDDSTT